MAALVWIGAALTLAGVAILMGCIVAVARARRAMRGEAALRARLQWALAWNLGALALSALGLIAVTTGLLLG